jgi:hypothetical protein
VAVPETWVLSFQKKRRRPRLFADAGFYSALERSIEEKLPGRAPSKDIKTFVERNAKAAEIEQSGIMDFLDSKDRVVGKREVLEYLKANSPELKIVVKEGNETKFPDTVSSGGENYKEIFVTAPKESTEWQQGHKEFADVKNPIVHLRTTDGELEDGRTALRVEEIQPVDAENQAKMPPAYQKYATEIGIKYALKYASDNGFDAVTFTTGKTQNARYRASDAVSGFSFTKNGDNYRLSFEPVGDASPVSRNIPDAHLDKFLGKNLAKHSANPASPDISTIQRSRRMMSTCRIYTTRSNGH